MRDLDKYTIIPNKYIELLPIDMKKNLDAIINMVIEVRLVLGKDTDPKYYVCKTTEPYSNSVIDMIMEGEESKKRLYMEMNSNDEEEEDEKEWE